MAADNLVPWYIRRVGGEQWTLMHPVGLAKFPWEMAAAYCEQHHAEWGEPDEMEIEACLSIGGEVRTYTIQTRRSPSFEVVWTFLGFWREFARVSAMVGQFKATPAAQGGV